MSTPYNPQAIEARWQQYWLDHGTYEVDNDDPRPPYYVLSMYPYPSGPAHMGHVRNYTMGDLLVRYRTMRGDGVLSPIGFDSFGLPAENAAIQTGTHPRVNTEANIEALSASLRRIGAAYDWRRVVRSHDPSYIRWTQWIFLKFYEAGLVYRGQAPVNWCPGCQTVLANEQVLPDGTCERSGDVVENRDMEQWFYRITAYSQELLDDLDDLEWPNKVKVMQRNWIGRSEGAQFGLPIADAEGKARTDVEPLHVFTTRPDTGFGMTFAVISPEHPRLDELTTDDRRADVAAFRSSLAGRSEIDRLSSGDTLDKRGIATGGRVVNPFTGRAIPLFAADYVLMTYGTGAIMAVPGEDQRDWEFAEVHGCEIIRTIQPPDDFDGQAYLGDGPAVNSGFLDGLHVTEAKAAAIDWLEAEDLGERKVNYRLRDWLLSRQRYWGCPIPIVYCGDCGEQPVPADQLPVDLPDDVEFMPTGRSPLTTHEGFLAATCPSC
ncbi:MAG: leucine--tRNA ligase, partial [Acidimicrobiales bacterium]